MTDITHAAEMTLVRAGSSIQPAPDGISNKPFWIELLLSGTRDGQPTAMRATLDPGIVSNWHTHPAGQVLFVLSGVGLVQRDGGPIHEIRAGDCVWFAPNERHWHGACATSVLSYVSIQNVADGTAVNWLGAVEYRSLRSPFEHSAEA